MFWGCGEFDIVKVVSFYDKRCARFFFILCGVFYPFVQRAMCTSDGGVIICSTTTNAA